MAQEESLLGIIKQRVDKKRSAGIVLGMVGFGDRSHVVAYGDPGTGQLPLNQTSVFEIGSLTKVLTGILLSVMQQRGGVRLGANLDTPDRPLRRAMRDARVPRRKVGINIKIGLGWNVYTPIDRTLLWKNGGTGGSH